MFWILYNTYNTRWDLPRVASLWLLPGKLSTIHELHAPWSGL